jgi:hypothetical protein
VESGKKLAESAYELSTELLWKGRPVETESGGKALELGARGDERGARPDASVAMLILIRRG